MKKYILLCLTTIFWIALNTQALVNEVVLSVGNIPITSYDIEQMREFEGSISSRKPSRSEALKQLVIISSLLIIAENQTEYYMDEIELRKTINLMTQNSSDPSSKQRDDIYKLFPEIYRMVIRSDKVKRGLMHGNVQIKTMINKPISHSESLAFYKKHKEQFKDSPFPKLNLIIFAVESSAKWSLSELEDVEKAMEKLAKDLNTSSDYNALRKKYSKLKFTSFSGNTGLFTPDILILQKKIPDEIIGIALQETVNLGITKVTIKKNKGIYIPQPIPFRSTGKPTYLTLKILKIIEPEQLSFDEALPRIEDGIKFERAEKEINALIKKRIQEGLITLTATGNNYKHILKEFE